MNVTSPNPDLQNSNENLNVSLYHNNFAQIPRHFILNYKTQPNVPIFSRVVRTSTGTTKYSFEIFAHKKLPIPT